MENKIFLKDGSEIVSFSSLLEAVSKATEVFDPIKTPCFVDFVMNLVIGLSRGVNLTIIDSDVSAEELLTFGIGNSNVCEVASLQIDNFEDLLRLVNCSKSKITIFTSGTTGLPKKVVHSVSSFYKSVKKSQKHGDDIWALAYNPTHMAGLQVFFQAFFNANTIVNLFGKGNLDVVSAIENNKITHLSATPTFFRLLISTSKCFESLKSITCGGEKSDKMLFKRLGEVFPNAKINNIYASTEFGSLLCAQGEFFKIPENLKNFVKIENNQLKVHKSLTGDFDTDLLDGDFYATGDIVEFCEENSEFFKFVARESSLINVGGYKVNIEEVEDVIRQISEISDVRVFGRKNSVMGNILCADVKLRDGALFDIAMVRNFLTARLQSFKIPRIFNVVDNVKLTKTGKLKR